jgi:hypothetical protein
MPDLEPYLQSCNYHTLLLSEGLARIQEAYIIAVIKKGTYNKCRQCGRGSL